MTTPPLVSSSSAPAKKKPGCFFYGCLILVILMVIVGVGAGFGVWYVAKRVTAVLEEYTDTAPLEVPASEMSQASYASLEDRVREFGDGLKAGRPVEPLKLAAEDLNALLARSPALAEWKDRVHVQFEGSEVRARLSLPLDQLGELPMLKALRGRYLNGEAALGVGMAAGQLDVRLKALQVKGKPLPIEVLQALREQNLAEAANQDPAKAATLGRLSNVAVEDGQLVLTPRKE
jgi:hypothetical protein